MNQPVHSLSAIDVKGRKVLIVDDDRMSITILSAALRNDGYVLADAGSGEQALQIYSEFQPDLLLLDVVMPGISGIETYKRLKQDSGAECAPVFFITARNSSDDVIEILGTEGGVDYLPKPFNIAEVRARVRAQLQNQMLVAQQNQFVEQLSATNEEKNQLLAMAAHDMRDPLDSIHRLAQYLQDGMVGPISEDQRDLISTIHDASQSMLGMMNDLLDVAAIESGEFKLKVESCRLAELLERCVCLANVYATRKKTKIEFIPPSASGEIMIEIDSAKMRQVVDNLLSNAVKYSPPGSLVTAQMHTDPERGACSFSVRDQGPGIPENERDKLFTDFGRLSVKPTGGEKSTGLGLAICRKIVEAHGGVISAENLPGAGCEFHVVLPAHK